MYNIESKLLHYSLNCDYTIPYFQKDLQTNTLITKVLNEFINNYSAYFKTHTFILENNDDLITLINYVILCQLRELTNDFSFKILYKPKRLKNNFGKQERYINSKFFKTNKDYFIISSNNPIYKVEKSLSKSNDAIQNKISLFNNEPTPDELFIIQLYYCLALGNTPINPNNLKIIGLQNWLDKPFNYLAPPDLNSVINNMEKPLISYVFINGDNEKDIISLQEIEQEDTIALYYFNGENIPEILLDKTFCFLIKRKTNIPCVEYGNLNNEVLGDTFLAKDFPIKWIGEWKDKNLSHYKEVKIE